MKHSICPFLLFVYLLLGSTSIQAAASLDLYGNFHTLGITVTLDPADDPKGDAETTAVRACPARSITV
jgi:hypothetical protein